MKKQFLALIGAVALAAPLIGIAPAQAALRADPGAPDAPVIDLVRPATGIPDAVFVDWLPPKGPNGLDDDTSVTNYQYR